MKNQLLINMSKNGLALLAGTLLTLACAPFNIFPLAVLSAACLILLWLDVSKREALVRGFFYGLGLFGSGVYWIFISMHTYANLPAIAAAALTLLFIVCLSFFPAAQGYLLNRFFPRTNDTKILCAFPALWVLMEWIRSWFFSGFPWLFIGYSQTYSPLKGFAPLFSVYGVSLATVLSAALVINALKRPGRRYIYLWLLASLWVAGGLLSFIAWTAPNGKPIQVSLVQANIPQQLKWEPEQVEPTLSLYKQLSADHWDSQVIIWPEGAIPAALNDVTPFIHEMAQMAKSHHANLITGIPVRNTFNDRYYNAVISVGSSGDSFYLKHRLVPFGEYIPLERWLGRLFDFMNIPMSDLIADRGTQKPLDLPNNIKMLTFICYEIAFPEQVLHTLKNIGLILTVTNDAWFGHSIAQAQHLQMAQMRAMETGRPILFASNNGITAMISEKGKLLATAPPFTTYVLTHSIQPYIGETPWQRYAMDPILLIIYVFLFLAYRHRKAPEG